MDQSCNQVRMGNNSESKNNSKKKGCLKIFRHPILGLIFIMAGVLLYLLNLLIPKYGFTTPFFTGISSPSEVMRMSDGLLMVNEGYSTLYFADDENDRIDHIISICDMKNGEDSFIDYVVQGRDDHIYVHIAEVEDSGGRITGERICEYDGKGHYIRDAVSLQYSENDMQQVGDEHIRAVGYRDGMLSYVYNYNGENSIVRVGADGSTLDNTKIECPDGLEIYYVCEADDGYMAILTDASVARIGEDGSVERVQEAEGTITDMTEGNGFYPTAIFNAEGEIYLAEGIDSDYIWCLGEDGFEYCKSSWDFVGEEDEGFFVGNVYEINGVDDKLYIAIEDTMVIDDGESYEYFDPVYDLPVKYVILSLISLILPVLAVLLVILGLICEAAIFWGYRHTILFKLLRVLLPVALIMYAGLSALLIYTAYDQNRDSVSASVRMTSSFIAKYFDGDEIAAIDTADTETALKCSEYYELLEQLMSEIDADWVKTCTISVLKPDGNGGLVTLASTRGLTPPFSAGYDFDAMMQSEDTTVELESFNLNDDYEDVFTKIYDSDGNATGVVAVSMSFSDLEDARNKQLRDAILMVLVFAVIEVIILWIICYFISKSLKAAGNAISKVASGDFEARIDNIPNDEIGIICSGVNNMASQLSDMFVQKDKNEKFYYKFVPEQFRELLHKESFTDLELGDAESTDLTVLFCDIRSFSLNSEMMTAKENFEFVNVIYGIAGPIVRKHGGFVDKYIGDAVMSLFQNADDAIAAGKEIYSSIVLDKGTAERLGMSSINIGVGIHSGMARIGIVGEDERMSGTVISNTVNISSRLESLTKQYHTAMIITKDTLDRMNDPDSLQIRYLGMVQVAGVNEVKAIYEVLDALDPDLREERIRTRDDFKEGVRLFHLKEPEKSVEYFKRVKESSQNDPVVDIYIEYIEEFIRSGHKENYVFRFNKK